jgi:putative ABC transport system ATP-binding protein
MSYIIDAQGIVREFGSGDKLVRVLQGITLQVEEGEFIAIMGRSGAGKSTLLYQLSLLDHPTSGEIILDGVVTSVLSSEERTRFRLERLGYIFQDYALVPDLTAIENVAVPLLMQGRSKDEAYRLAGEALTSVGLGERMRYLPSKLSGGEQQRVSIARAIAHRPKILFADEPTANLDTETSRQVLDIMKRLNDDGQTIVMVTHEREYGEIADRIVTLSDGRIVTYR